MRVRGTGTPLVRFTERVTQTGLGSFARVSIMLLPTISAGSVCVCVCVCVCVYGLVCYVCV